MTDNTRTTAARYQAIENRRARAFKRGALTATRSGHARSHTPAPAWR